MRQLLFLNIKVLTNDNCLSFTAHQELEGFPGEGRIMMAMTAERQNAIQRASRALLVFFIFISVISVWSTLANIAHAPPTDIRVLAGVELQGAAVTDKIQAIWLGQMALSAALGLKVLYHLIRLMVLHIRGSVFTAQNVSQLRQVGLTYTAAVLLWLLVLVAAMPEIAAAQDQWLRIMPSFPGGALMSAFLFLFASRIIDEGREMREEQELVI